LKLVSDLVLRFNILNISRSVSLTTSDLLLSVLTSSGSPRSSVVIITTIRIILSLSNQPGAPHFNETNISNFLKNQSDIYIDCGIREDEKVRRFPKYISDSVSNYIKTLQKYEDRK